MYKSFSQWLFTDTEIDELEWPLCIKVCFGILGTLCVCMFLLSDKTVGKFAEVIAAKM